MSTAAPYLVLFLVVAVLIVAIGVLVRWSQKHVRFGPPAHPEFKDQWLGDDTDIHDED